MSFFEKHLFFCTNQKEAGKKCCQDADAISFFEYTKQRIHDLALNGPGKIRVSKSGCLGRCSLGPCLAVYPEGVWYTYHSFADIDEIIEKHIVQGEIVDRLCLPQ